MTQELDTERVQAFSGEVMGHLNGGMLCLMIGIANQTGLFDTMAGMELSTSEEIARACRLNERYVREWLNCMVTGNIVDYDPASRKYRLPAEHAASLTKAAGPNNLASFAQLVAEMARVEQGIVECFRSGGGVPYSEYPRFQELMRQESAQVFDATLVDVTLALVPGLIERLKAGIDVADIGCGAGHAVNLMARAFPASRFVGLDFSEEGIGLGRDEARAMGLTNARFEVQDAAKLSDLDAYDLITTFDAVHDQAHPAAMLAGIHRALRPGGVYLCCDIAGSSNVEENMDHPLAPMLYAVSTMHCMTVSLAYGGDGLGTMWGQQVANQMLSEAGFTNIETRNVEADPFNVYYICQK